MMHLCVVLVFLAFTAVYAYPIENSYEKLLQQVNELQRTVAKLEKSVEQNNVMARNKRADVSPPVGISFSTILDDALSNIVIGQTIVFNKAYINDGDAYDTNTGVFTVPIDGVYLLSCFVGEYGQDQVLLQLQVNGQNKVDVIAEGIQVGHNDQGGNLVILKLGAGDRVLIQAYGVPNALIDGGADYKYTSFSGVLLYGAGI